MLVDDVRMAVRVMSTLTDPEINAYIDAAISDMRRVGIRDGLLERESLSPMAKAAVIMYCKANYGFDNSESEMYLTRYKWTVTSMLNSSMNECHEQVG